MSYGRRLFLTHGSQQKGIVLRESIACYGEEWKETSTNPCVVGDTKIALAIKDLAEIGNDVPV